MTASAVTIHHYAEADLTMNERALAGLHEPEAKIQRYRAPDSLIDFLKTRINKNAYSGPTAEIDPRDDRMAACASSRHPSTLRCRK